MSMWVHIYERALETAHLPGVIRVIMQAEYVLDIMRSLVERSWFETSCEIIDRHAVAFAKFGLRGWSLVGEMFTRPHMWWNEVPPARLMSGNMTAQARAWLPEPSRAPTISEWYAALVAACPPIVLR